MQTCTPKYSQEAKKTLKHSHMQSTSDTSNQSATHSKVDEPRHLTNRAIKYLQDSQETKHHFNLDYVL